ncbi:hypothetical protein [Halomarina rubra]|uniref:MYXO-CTERM domain-containing protein n=1 Tax=Halomarina rubra TaxID=2071873 RepID=A0ABD6B0E8_9EURY|nr:hypothetical protein [Halomarina rubra]
MADITLFKVDLSESTFVAPFGRHVVADRVETDDETDEESGGGRGKLLLAGVVGIALVGGLAFALVRRVRGGDDDAEPPEETEWGDDDWSADREGRRFGDDGSDVDALDGDTREEGFVELGPQTDEESARGGAVAAVVGLLFLLFVTALVRRRRATPTTDEYAVEDAEAATAAAER